MLNECSRKMIFAEKAPPVENCLNSDPFLPTCPTSLYLSHIIHIFLRLSDYLRCLNLSNCYFCLICYIFFLPVAPIFSVQPENIDILTGNTIKLVCVASGTPVPQITWFKDDLEVNRFVY